MTFLYNVQQINKKYLKLSYTKMYKIAPPYICIAVKAAADLCAQIFKEQRINELKIK